MARILCIGVAACFLALGVACTDEAGDVSDDSGSGGAPETVGLAATAGASGTGDGTAGRGATGGSAPGGHGGAGGVSGRGGTAGKTTGGFAGCCTFHGTPGGAAGEGGEAGSGGATRDGSAGWAGAWTRRIGTEVWAECTVESGDPPLVRLDAWALCASHGACEDDLAEQRSAVGSFVEGTGCDLVTVVVDTIDGTSVLQYDAASGERVSARVPYGMAPWVECGEAPEEPLPAGGLYVTGEVQDDCETASWCSHENADADLPDCTGS